MTLHNLPQFVDRLEGFDSLLAKLSSDHGHGQIDGLTGASKGLVLARIFEQHGGRLFVITYQQEQAQRLWDDLRHFGVPNEQIHILPSTEGRWLTNNVTDYRALGERITALSSIVNHEDCIVIGTAEAAFQRTSPPSELLSPVFSIRPGMTIDLDVTLRALVDMGYESDTTVSRPGQFSRRGGIMDIYPSTSDTPVRLELFGDEVESLRAFDIGTQRSTGTRAAVVIAPLREVRLSGERVTAAVSKIKAVYSRRAMELAKAKEKTAFGVLKAKVDDDLELLQNCVYFEGIEQYSSYLLPENICALDYLRANSETWEIEQEASNALVILDEPGQVNAHWDRLSTELKESRDRKYERGELLDNEEFNQTIGGCIKRVGEQFSTLVMTQLSRIYEGLPTGQRISVSTAVLENYRSRITYFVNEVQTWLQNNAECIVVSDQPQRVKEICSELKLPVGESGADGKKVTVCEGRLRQGFKFADIRLYVVTDAELFGSTRPVVTRRRATGGIPISTILDLRENDYVVHVQHGIGIYRGLVKRQVDGADRDYLYVQYTDGGLYVPADQIDRVQRYIGGDANPPTLNRIGGNEWQRTTRRAKEHAQSMAKELIELYAARQAAERPSLGDDTPWQTEMEDAFPYEETHGQMRAIQDIKGDLEGNKPMDRLICGDVGFGKTEVAIRAAFKVLEAGKQVAVLCPTTVLAAQHHTTFSERLAAYPIEVGLLSRFRSRQEQKLTTEGLKNGSVDIVIGTHRLLSKDVEFEKLGLIIVDEEQRFGVAHKERLKQLRKSVDVLTLTATPIPRTLSMALSGLRDMSVIDDPPTGRTPIVTYVREYDDEIIRDAILRELERDGQIYFVHNRIESIDYLTERIQKLVPDARIRVGHGQMSEDELEKIMFDFYHQKYDILVCTTIIENGLDIPNVNTIIVDNADKMGLAQLYQLRGRVGRSNRQAYAYLLHQRHKQLSEDAERRLVAIREFTALGSGYQIAMRDLEIRGAGNLLGSEQSGAMLSVGFDMYCQLLAEAVAETKGEESVDETLPPVDLPITAHIPNEYIPNEAERIFFYKRMSNVRSSEDIAALQEELEDRYGDPPKPVWAALAVLRLRLRAKKAGIAAIRGERKEVNMKFAPHVRLTPDAIRLLTHLFKKHRFTGDSVVVTLTSPKVLEEVDDIVDVLERALSEAKRSTNATKKKL